MCYAGRTSLHSAPFGACFPSTPSSGRGKIPTPLLITRGGHRQHNTPTLAFVLPNYKLHGKVLNRGRTLQITFNSSKREGGKTVASLLDLRPRFKAYIEEWEIAFVKVACVEAVICFLFFLNCRCELSSGLNGFTWSCTSKCSHFTFRQCSLGTREMDLCASPGSSELPVNFQAWPLEQLSWSCLIQDARGFRCKTNGSDLLTWIWTPYTGTVNKRLARRRALDVSQTVVQISPQGCCPEFLTAELGLRLTAGNKIYFDQD